MILTGKTAEMNLGLMAAAVRSDSVLLALCDVCGADVPNVQVLRDGEGAVGVGGLDCRDDGYNSGVVDAQV